jgi:hypothetical protein
MTKSPSAQVYPSLVAAYGWPSVFYMLSAMVAGSTLCIVTQQRLQARQRRGRTLPRQ